MKLKNRFSKIASNSGLAIKICLVMGMGLLWIYAFFFAPSGNPDRLSERMCQKASLQINDLPSAREASTPADRANVLEEATSILENMKTDIAALTLQKEKDRFNVSSWLTDWETYIQDRKNHVRRLREEGDVEPLLTALTDSKSIVERMNGFARVNDLKNCLDPGDF